jgi:2-hydroxy-3-keto-5-methylthiopentenyl-1-phosphate phosphatase
MNDTSRKEFIFASDFDQTLTFNDSGYVLAELVGIPTANSSVSPPAWRA